MLRSDLARLVLAYLHQEACLTTAASFVKESSHLKEWSKQPVRTQSKFKFDGRTLWQLAQEFVEIRDRCESGSEAACPLEHVDPVPSTQQTSIDQSRTTLRSNPDLPPCSPTRIAHPSKDDMAQVWSDAYRHHMVNVNNYRPQELIPVENAPYLAPDDPTPTPQCAECRWRRKACSTCVRYRRQNWSRHLAEKKRQEERESVERRPLSPLTVQSSHRDDMATTTGGLTNTIDDFLSPRKLSPRRKTSKPKRGRGKSAAPKRLNKRPTGATDNGETVMAHLLEEMLTNETLQNQMAKKINEAVAKPAEPAPVINCALPDQIPEVLTYGEAIDEILNIIDEQVVSGAPVTTADPLYPCPSHRTGDLPQSTANPAPKRAITADQITNHARQLEICSQSIDTAKMAVSCEERTDERTVDDHSDTIGSGTAERLDSSLNATRSSAVVDEDGSAKGRGENATAKDGSTSRQPLVSESDDFVLAMSPTNSPVITRSSVKTATQRKDETQNMTVIIADGQSKSNDASKESDSEPRRKRAVRMLFQSGEERSDKENADGVVESSSNAPVPESTNESADTGSLSPEVKDDLVSCHIEDSLCVEVHRVVVTDSPAKNTRSATTTSGKSPDEQRVKVKESPISGSKIVTESDRRLRSGHLITSPKKSPFFQYSSPALTPNKVGGLPEDELATPLVTPPSGSSGLQGQAVSSGKKSPASRSKSSKTHLKAMATTGTESLPSQVQFTSELEQQPSTPALANLCDVSMDNSSDVFCPKTVNKSLFELLSDSPPVHSRPQVLYRWSTPTSSRVTNTPVRVSDSHYDDLQASAIASIMRRTPVKKPRRLAIRKIVTPVKTVEDEELLSEPEQECAIASILNLTPVKRTPVKAAPILVQGYELSPPKNHSSDSVSAAVPAPAAPPHVLKDRLDFAVPSPVISLDESHQTEWNHLIRSAEKERLQVEQERTPGDKTNKSSQNDTLVAFAAGHLDEFEYVTPAKTSDAVVTTTAVDKDTEKQPTVPVTPLQPHLMFGNETMNDILDMLPAVDVPSDERVAVTEAAKLAEELKSSVVGTAMIAVDGMAEVNGDSVAVNTGKGTAQGTAQVALAKPNARKPATNTKKLSPRPRRSNKKAPIQTQPISTMVKVPLPAVSGPYDTKVLKQPTASKQLKPESLIINGRRYEAIPVTGNKAQIQARTGAQMYTVSANEWSKIKRESTSKPDYTITQPVESVRPVSNAVVANPMQTLAAPTASIPGASFFTLPNGASVVLVQQQGLQVPYTMTQTGWVKSTIPVVQADVPENVAKNEIKAGPSKSTLPSKASPPEKSDTESVGYIAPLVIADPGGEVSPVDENGKNKNSKKRRSRAKSKDGGNRSVEGGVNTKSSFETDNTNAKDDGITSIERKDEKNSKKKRSRSKSKDGSKRNGSKNLTSSKDTKRKSTTPVKKDEMAAKQMAELKERLALRAEERSKRKVLMTAKARRAKNAESPSKSTKKALEQKVTIDLACSENVDLDMSTDLPDLMISPRLSTDSPQVMKSPRLVIEKLAESGLSLDSKATKARKSAGSDKSQNRKIEKKVVSVTQNSSETITKMSPSKSRMDKTEPKSTIDSVATKKPRTSELALKSLIPTPRKGGTKATTRNANKPTSKVIEQDCMKTNNKNADDLVLSDGELPDLHDVQNRIPEATATPVVAVVGSLPSNRKRTKLEAEEGGTSSAPSSGSKLQMLQRKMKKRKLDKFLDSLYKDNS